MKRTVLLIFVLILWTVSCTGDDTGPQPNVDAEQRGVPALESVDETPTESDELPPTTAAEPGATATPDPYASLAPTAAPDSYPADGSTGADVAGPAYPAEGTTWVIRPLGTQCSDPTSYEFKTVDEARIALEEAGITVYVAEVTLRGVCEACDCATAEHYRVRIDEANFSAAQAMGWERE